MLGSMMHEQFYKCRKFAAPELGAYAGSVFDTESPAAGQSMTSDGGELALAFAGEEFTVDDVGSLLARYSEEGLSLLPRLNGLFSGLLIDRRNRRAILFNDRFGFERIYVAETADGTFFASEAKALLAVLPELRSFDADGLADFLRFGCTLENRTLFRGVRLLPAASQWLFETGCCRKSSYFTPQVWESQAAVGEQEFDDEFAATFQRILPRYLTKTSSLGISLTAGLDTRMIMACLPNSVPNPVCYTFAGEKKTTLDARLSSLVASESGLRHEIIRIGADFFGSFQSHADKTVFVSDGTFGVLGAHETYFNAQARRLASVRLTGNYGSEVLRGMSTFKPVGLDPSILERESRPLVARSSEDAARPEHPVTFAATREIPWNLFGNAAAGRAQVTLRTPYLDNELVALAYRAPRASRWSGDAAVRFIRRVRPAVARIPTDRGLLGNAPSGLGRAKHFLSEAACKLDYFYSEGLPHPLAALNPLMELGVGATVGGSHKFLPYRIWFREQLATYVREALAEAVGRANPIWDLNVVARLASDHIRGRKNYVREINVILTLDAVDRLLLRGTTRPDITDSIATYSGADDAGAEPVPAASPAAVNVS